MVDLFKEILLIYKLYKHIWERQENILKKSFLTIFLAKPYYSVQIVQVENRLTRFIFSEFFSLCTSCTSPFGRDIKILSRNLFQYQLCKILLQCTNCTSERLTVKVYLFKQVFCLYKFYNRIWKNWENIQKEYFASFLSKTFPQWPSQANISRAN